MWEMLFQACCDLQDLILGHIIKHNYICQYRLCFCKGTGFIKYNGMTAEQFVWAWIKSEFLMPKKLMFLPDNLYYETMKPTIEANEKGLPTVRKKQKGRTPKPKKTKKKKAKCSKEVNNAENS